MDNSVCKKNPWASLLLGELLGRTVHFVLHPQSTAIPLDRKESHSWLEILDIIFGYLHARQPTTNVIIFPKPRKLVLPVDNSKAHSSSGQHLLVEKLVGPT